ncbi:hypothetical protein M422DRAFT_265489 [Sphaerobolus stellatus SS14]|uniref:Uncharacterized protein n=1 Tax=Sphaerobolus stellatus (strain SS14) TaxID=990650 RepID=A0A0C9UD05_SPHS4|nr:hypothetical protein M422DRAFT_265489 [Sphaerobolus stellatus SS14]
MSDILQPSRMMLGGSFFYCNIHPPSLPEATINTPMSPAASASPFAPLPTHHPPSTIHLLGHRGVLPYCGRRSRTPLVAVRTVRSRSFPPPAASPTGSFPTVAVAHGPLSSSCAPCAAALSRPPPLHPQWAPRPSRTTPCALFVHSDVPGDLPYCGHCSRTPLVAVRTVRAPSFPPPATSPTGFFPAVVGAPGPPSSPYAPCALASSRPPPLYLHPASRPPRTMRCTLFVHSNVLGALGSCAHRSQAPLVAVRTVRTRTFPPPAALPTPGLTAP